MMKRILLYLSITIALASTMSIAYGADPGGGDHGGGHGGLRVHEQSRPMR